MRNTYSTPFTVALQKAEPVFASRRGIGKYVGLVRQLSQHCLCFSGEKESCRRELRAYVAEGSNELEQFPVCIVSSLGSPFPQLLFRP